MSDSARIRLAPSVCIAAILALACSSRPAQVRPGAQDVGATLVVYAQPLTVVGGRLVLRPGGLWAIGEDGSRTQVPLLLAEIGGADSNRERLLAWGGVPPGSYDGLELRLDSATLAGGGEAPVELVVPEAAIAVDVPLTVRRDAATVVSLRLDGSAVQGGRLDPEFVGELPQRPPAALVGVATNRDAGTVTLFDRRAGRVVAVVPVGRSPAGVVTDLERERAYVALAGEGAVAVVDLDQQQVLSRVPLSGGDRPEELALTPDRAWLLVVNSGSNSVSFVDAGALIEEERLTVGDGPVAVEIDSQGNRAYVFNRLSDSISVIDLARRELAATIATEAGPLRGQLDLDGRRLYVIHASSSHLLVVDTVTFTSTTRVYVGPGASALRVDPRSGRIFVARHLVDAVDVFDPTSLLPVDSVRVRTDVAYMAVDSQENLLWLVFSKQGLARAVRLSGGQDVRAVDLGGNPYRLALMGER